MVCQACVVPTCCWNIEKPPTRSILKSQRRIVINDSNKFHCQLCLPSYHILKPPFLPLSSSHKPNPKVQTLKHSYTRYIHPSNTSRPHLLSIAPSPHAVFLNNVRPSSDGNGKEFDRNGVYIPKSRRMGVEDSGVRGESFHHSILGWRMIQVRDLEVFAWW